MSPTPRSVLLVTPTLGRDGGVATHAFASAEAMTAAGYEVTMAVERVEADAPRGVEVARIPALGGRRPPEAAREAVARVAARRAVELVHLHDVAPHPLGDRLRAIAPLVVSTHGYACCTPNTHYFAPGHECTRPHGAGCVPNMLLRGCAHSRDPRPIPGLFADTTRRRRGLQSADAVVGYSTATLRQLRRNGLERVHYVRYFSAVQPDPPAVGRERRVLFVGRVVKAKGLAVLVRALAQVEAELHVHGDGWAVPGVRRQAEALGVADRISFHGWSGPQALASAYLAARVVVVPSLWPEPFGIVGTDAMSFGRPVVASATGGIPDWLRDGETGVAVAPGDATALAGALERLLTPTGEAERMGARGLEVVRSEFSPEAHLRDLEATYAAARAGWLTGQ